MGKVLVVDYEFDASAGTVKLPGYSTIKLESLLLITNITDGIIIYNFADPNKGATAGGNTITLEYATSSMSDNDQLQIFYQETSEDSAASGGDVVQDLSANDLLGHIYTELLRVNVQLARITDEEVDETDLQDDNI